MPDQNLWSSALTTFGATIAGASVSGIVAWSLFNRELASNSTARQHEADERYEVRLTEALARLLGEIAQHAKALLSVDASSKNPGTFALSTAVDVALIVAKDQDLQMLQILNQALLNDSARSMEMIITKLGILSSAITSWRVGDHTYNYCYSEIKSWALAEGPDPL